MSAELDRVLKIQSAATTEHKTAGITIKEHKQYIKCLMIGFLLPCFASRRV